MLIPEIFFKGIQVASKQAPMERIAASTIGIIGTDTKGIMESLKMKDKSLQCSAEGHVSHIYADRMSSRPLG